MTKQEARLLTVLRERVSADGASPTYREMADAMGLKSKSGINRLIVSLESQDRIRRRGIQNRTVELTDERCWSCGALRHRPMVDAP